LESPETLLHLATKAEKPDGDMDQILPHPLWIGHADDGRVYRRVARPRNPGNRPAGRRGAAIEAPARRLLLMPFTVRSMMAVVAVTAVLIWLNFVDA
jgi:hypothetical protein